MSVTLTLSKQQAALLLPFVEQLQQPLALTVQNETTPSVEARDSETVTFGSKRRPYSAEELLQKKKRNTKSN